MTHIYSVCDGGQDHIYKQYCFIAHLSDVNRRKGKKYRKKEREEMMYSTLIYQLAVTDATLNQNE